MSASKRYAGPPIVWRACPLCEKRYDDGNPFASFAHRNRECLVPTEATPPGSEAGK